MAPGRPAGRRLVIGVGRYLLAAAILFAFLVPAASLVPTSLRQPWDLKTYGFAVRAAAQGKNPYDTAVLSRVAGGSVGMPFLYPPVTLPLLVPLAALPFEQASDVWSWIKLLMLAALVLLWRSFFLPDVHLVLLALIATLGFNAASVWDIRSGNVAMLEQVLLWVGFAAYTRGRRVAFASCVVAAALFKIFPGSFLLLLLIPVGTWKPAWKLAVVAIGSMAVLVLGPALLGPPWAHGFFHLMSGDRPIGAVNPSALGIIDTLLGTQAMPLTRPPYHALGLFLAFDAALVGLSVPTLRRLWRRGDPREWVLASVILYSLLAPRMMVYTYVLVLVPALALAAPAIAPVGGRVIVTVLLVAQAFWNTFRVLLKAPGPVYSGIVDANLSFLILLTLWLIYVAKGGRQEVPVGPSPR